MGLVDGVASAHTGTRISGSLDCARKAVLEERYGGGGGGASAAAAAGTLLHELLQAALKEGISGADALVARGRDLIRASTARLLEVPCCHRQAACVQQGAWFLVNSESFPDHMQQPSCRPEISLPWTSLPAEHYNPKHYKFKTTGRVC